jgi:probable F420-dependent oxidoreductase
MELGIVVTPGERTMDPAGLARAAEERGFGSIFVPEHTHVPVGSARIVNTDTGDPFTAGQSLGQRYGNLFDPFVWLAVAAGATSRIRLGTGICNVVQRDPIVLAKEVASLDVLSNGRLILGIGFGWDDIELRNHGIDPRHRRRLFREKVLAMQRLWQDPVASFDGELVKISDALAFPKPVQKPHPPLFLGVTRPAGFRHLVEYCDGWIAANEFDRTLLDELRCAAEDHGRDPKAIRLSAHRVAADPRALDELASLGFERATLSVPSDTADVVLPVLDRYARLIQLD